MNTLRQLLDETLDEASFEVVLPATHPSGNQPRSGRRVSAAGLRDLVSRPQWETRRQQVSVDAPQPAMAALADSLRSELERFVDPQYDRIGHAFPTDSLVPENKTRSTSKRFRPDGLAEEAHTSSVLAFATSLVRAAAIDGIEPVIEQLAGWVRGAAVEVQATIVLNNLYLSGPATVTDAIELAPLGLTTDSLPRLPTGFGGSVADYLGLTLLRAKARATPALFRPPDSAGERPVRLSPAHPIDFDLICRALSLSTGRHVTWAHQWNDYPETRAFFLGTPSMSNPAGNRLRSIPFKRLGREPESGFAEVEPSDDIEFLALDVDALRPVLEALPGADRKLLMALDRWSRCTNPDNQLADRYIDLRIALELLYLQQFRQDSTVHSEMRFRLALFGAWHLSDGPKGRARIRKDLLDAYDTASGAVHTGDVPANAKTESLLSQAQSLCRRGMLELLREGAPDWGRLVLGA